MHLSTTLALRGDIFRLAFFIALLTFNDLEKGIALNRHVVLCTRMDRRFSLRHENPIFAL
jgi:hypothetical protein